MTHTKDVCCGTSALRTSNPQQGAAATNVSDKAGRGPASGLGNPVLPLLRIPHVSIPTVGPKAAAALGGEAG